MEVRSVDVSSHTWADALRSALAWPVSKRSLMIMVVVGSILNIINQGDAILTGGAISWWKVALTYCVPFCVATYGACCAYRASARDRVRSNDHLEALPGDHGDTYVGAKRGGPLLAHRVSNSGVDGRCTPKADSLRVWRATNGASP